MRGTKGSMFVSSDVLGARSYLRCFFSSASVAVIGATDREGSVGGTVVRNLQGGSYKGRFYAVNRRRAEVGGVPCYASIRAVPEAVDLVVVVSALCCFSDQGASSWRCIATGPSRSLH